MTAPVEPEKGRKLEASTDAFQRRVALYHYFPQLGDPSDPAYKRMRREAVDLKDHCLAKLVGSVVALVIQDIELGKTEEQNIGFRALLASLKFGQSRMKAEAGAMLFSDLIDPQFGQFVQIPITDEKRSRGGIGLLDIGIISNVGERSDLDRLLEMICDPENDSYGALLQRDDLWQASIFGGNNWTSVPIQTQIEGVELEINRYYDASGLNTWLNCKFKLTPDAAQLVAKAPLLDIPEFLPPQQPT